MSSYKSAPVCSVRQCFESRHIHMHAYVHTQPAYRGNIILFIFRAVFPFSLFFSCLSIDYYSELILAAEHVRVVSSSAGSRGYDDLQVYNYQDNITKFRDDCGGDTISSEGGNKSDDESDNTASESGGCADDCDGGDKKVSGKIYSNIDGVCGVWRRCYW